MDSVEVVIVGTGHGGAQAAIALRQQGFEGSILMVGRDPEPPYERPPLSKEYLAGEKPFERIYIRPPQFWQERGIVLKLATHVESLDPRAQEIVFGDGTRVGYGKLIWAAGGDPRRLSCPGGDLSGVHSVRDRADVDRITAQLEAGARNVVVIGGGYIGLEAAAVLTRMDCRVTLLEALPRVLARVAGKELSDFYEAEHRAHGVDLRLDASVDRLEGENGWVRRVCLADGSEIACDLAVVGIGIVPAVGPLIAAGAAGANGVDVDAFCRTSLKNVYAIGDCAAHANAWAGGAVVRLESVQNAHDMASTAARHICGGDEPYRAFPWFWSNQYDLRLQTAGLSVDHDETVVRGDAAQRKFSVVYLQHGRVIALDCVNNTKDYVQGRKLIEAKTEVSREQLADAETPLKSLL